MSMTAAEVTERVKPVLVRHPVTFAMLFGSTARDDVAEPGDVDVAVEFEDDVRDDGYSDAYLALASDLEAALDADVDVVTIDSMSPALAAVAFEEGVVVVGTEARTDELARTVAGDLPSTEASRERVAAAAARLARGSE